MEGKKEMDDEYCGKPEGKATERHPHQITWTFGKETIVNNVVCKEAGTVYESLLTNPRFKEEAIKYQEKELVIILKAPNEKALCSHFPCHKICKTDTLQIIYISAGNNQNTTTSSKDKKENHGKLVKFEIKTTGGKNLTNIMRNGELKSQADEVIVYGYVGHTVGEVLERDGRFSDKVLQKLYLLKEGDEVFEKSSVIDCFDGRCFKIVENRKRISHVAAKHDAPKGETSSKTASSNIPTPHQNVSNEPTPSTSNQPTPNEGDQLNREVIYNLLRSRFPDLAKCMKKRKDAESPDVRQLFPKEFGKNESFCKKAKTMRTFLELGDSVCQVRTNDCVASGFLLFGKYILTNAHVVTDKKNRKEKITVAFGYEDGSEIVLLPATVEAWTYHVEGNYKEDWALLEVCGDDLKALPRTPQPLLQHFGFVKKEGQICIIGHPQGEVKMIDPCFTISQDIFEGQHRKNLINIIFRDVHVYKTSFYHGASGSPVFDINFKVVSMHTGGFDNKNDEPGIEYSHPLSLITEQIIIKIVSMKSVNMLLAMITCVIHPKVMENIKETVESNPTEFVWSKDEMINLTESISDDEQKRLQDFFGFFPQRDEPMDSR